MCLQPLILTLWLTRAAVVATGTWLEGLYTGLAVSLALRTQRVDVVLPYCLVCGLDNAPSFTAGPLNGTHNGAEILPSLAGKATWSLTPKGDTVSELMLAVSARGGANAGNASMVPLTFSPDLPLAPSMAGTSQLTGWAFVTMPSRQFDGCVLFALGTSSNGTTLDLSALLGQTDEAIGWQLSVKHQEGGATALLQNISTVSRVVATVPADHHVTVPPYSVVTIDKISR